MNKNIIFIYPFQDNVKKCRFGFSYKMLQIATIFQNYGNNVLILDYSYLSFNKKYLFDTIINFKTDAISIEFDSFSLKRSQNDKSGLIIINFLKKIKLDFFIVVYGDYFYFSHKNIKEANFTIISNNINDLLSVFNKIFNGNIPLIKNYDLIPYINRELLYNIDFFYKNKYSTLVETSSGCSNTCSFCQIKKKYNNFACHSIDYSVNEFKYLSLKNYKNVWIIDENFTFNLDRAKKLLTCLIKHRYSKNMNIFISSWTNIDKEFLDIALKANIKTISFGIESANNEILLYYNKKVDLLKFNEIALYCHKIGIFLIGNFILGAPMETYDTINTTFKYIEYIKFDQVNIKILDYMQGSDIYNNNIDMMNNKFHVFACKENKLNNFYLNDLIEIKNKFLKQYYKKNYYRLMYKIHSFGMPYLPLKI